MINKTLLKREIKSNFKILLIFIAVLAMYVSIIVSMFDPAIGKTLEEFEKAMPDIMAAFGMTSSGSTLVEFLCTYLFGFLLLIFPMIYEIIIANKLIAKYVDNGSMAYLLATPNTRKKIAVTQILYLVGSLAILIIITLLIGILCSEGMFSGQLDIKKYVLLHVGVYCLHISISGLAFFSSCVFDETKKSYALSVGIPIGFYLIQMLANMGGKLENLKYITVFTLFDTDKLLQGETQGFLLIGVLLLIGIVFYLLGVLRFMKRDLPL